MGHLGCRTLSNTPTLPATEDGTITLMVTFTNVNEMPTLTISEDSALHSAVVAFDISSNPSRP